MKLLEVMQPLRRRLPLLITSLLFVVVGAASWSAYHYLEGALIVATGDRITAATQRLSLLLDESANRLRREMQRIAALPEVVAAARPARAGAIDAARRTLEKELSAGPEPAMMIAILDAAERPVLVVGQAAPAPVLPPRTTLAATVDSVRRGWLGPFASFHDSLYLSTAAPIIGAKRDTLGYVLAYRALVNGQSQSVSALIGAGATLAIANSDGTVWNDLFRPTSGPPASVTSGTASEYRAPNGERLIGTVLPMRAAPWQVAVAIPVEAALLPARPFVDRLIIIGIVVLTVGAVVAWLLSRRVTAPLLDVSRAATDFAGGNYSRRAPVRGNDEIAGMAVAFNRMAEQVESSSSALEDQAAELEAANEELRESELRYRGLVEHSPDAIIVHRDMRLLFANDAAAKLVGAASVAGNEHRSVLDFVHPADRAAAEARIHRNAELRQPTPLLEQRMVTLDGAVINVETIGMPFTLDGEPAVLTIIRDVSERKRLEGHIRQAQRMEAVGQLAGGIAHDFNNLLTVITSYSAMLLAEDDTASAVRADLEEIKNAADRAAGLTRQLLAFSRRQLLQPRVIDVNELTLNLEKMLRRLLREDIDLVTSLDPDLGLIHADPGQLEQVIVNLVVNARDAMPNGGHLSITTTNVALDESFVPMPSGGPGNYVMLAVSDTGHGMSDAVKAKIFEPFFTTKETGKGTGLGLSTVYGIVQQSGGSVWVYSEVERGTTFRIYLPLADRARTSREVPVPRIALSARSETILLVEDEELVRRAARRILERSGYVVLEAATGAEAVRICESHPTPIGLVVTDMVMPEMGGRELSSWVGRLRPDAKILFMSGYTEDVALRQNILAPGALFLDKPFTPVTLTQKVREALNAA